LKALVFHYSLPRQIFSVLLGKITPYAYLIPGSPFGMEEIPDPVLPGEDWVLVRTGLTGICGSDAKQVFLVGTLDNPLTALITFPQVLGHEVVGTVEQVGSAVENLQVGQRVALNPWLSCLPRDVLPICDACQRGEYYLCDHFTEGKLPPGMHIGNCSPITGGFAPLLTAHQSQWFPIPDSVSFDQAVLADPFSVSLHGVLKAPPKEGDLAVVYGCGTLGLLTIAILRTYYPKTTVIALARYPQQERMARKFGAQYVFQDNPPLDIIENVAEIANAKIHRPWHGKPMLMRGVQVIYDTVGSPETLEVGIRIIQPHGKLVITGVANPKRFEWTPLYFKEVEILGSNAFGVEEFQEMQLHAIQIYLKLLEQGQLDILPLITHRFRLDQFREAMLTTHNKAKDGVVKAVFDFT